MKLTLVATPIGNLGDLSPRATQTLADADFWLVEDTRVSGRLQSVVGVKRPMKVVNDHTPESRLEALVAEIAAAREVALISDAGCPGLSDPGAKLVDLCYEGALEIDAIPGPSAVTTALMLSGFFAQRFAFLGYLPRKPGEQKEILREFSTSSLTLVLFESPFRTEKLLGILGEILGTRRYAVCREMTKAHQQVYRNRLPNKPSLSEVPAKGEMTIVVEGIRRGSEAKEE